MSPTARGCCTDGPTDFCEVKTSVVVFPMTRAASPEQGAAGSVLPSHQLQFWGPELTCSQSGTRLMRRQSNESTDSWEISVTKVL